MQATTTLPSIFRTRSERRPSDTRHVVSAADARNRRSGGPQDQALYRCGCGHAFKAEVTTSVGCPNCGAGQAW